MAKIQQNVFNGGINNALENHLLRDSEAADLLDADISSGVLRSNVAKGVTADPKIDELTYQDGNRSIVKFGNHVYWSDNRDGTLGSTLGYVGITPPVDQISARSGDNGDRFEGTYRYLVLFKTLEGHRSAPFFLSDSDRLPVVFIADLTVEQILDQGNFPAFNSANFIEKYPKLSQGGTAGAPLAGQFIYLYGYGAGDRVNHLGKSWKARTNVLASVDNIPPNLLAEGQDPIPEDKHPGGSAGLWEDITGVSERINGVDAIILSNFPTPIESEVDLIEIYRTTSNGDQYYRVTEVPIGTSEYRDIMLDGELILNRQLFFDNGLPPIYPVASDIRGNNRFGGKYLIEVNERFFLAVKNFLYHSLQSDPHSYNPLHRIHFDSDITALAKFGSSILVFVGEGSPYLVTGNIEDGTVSKIQLPSNQGCPNWATVSYAGNAPVWQSTDGMCAITQQRDDILPTINVISKDRYNFSGSANFGVAKDDCYHLFFSDHSVQFDFGRNQIFRRSLTADYGHFSTLTGQLFLVEDDVIYDSDSGDEIAFTYLSPKLHTNDKDVLKNFNEITFDATNDVTVSLWYDDLKVLDSFVIKKDHHIKDIKMPRGEAYSVQIEAKCLGKIRSYSIEYMAKRGGQK